MVDILARTMTASLFAAHKDRTWEGRMVEAEVVIEAWGARLAGVRLELSLAGSPERCVERVAVEIGEPSRVMVLERLEALQAESRERVGLVLEGLARAGFTRTAPYCRSLDQRFGVHLGGWWWQLSPFVEGGEIDRPAYLGSAAAGREMARVLADMRRAALEAALPPGLEGRRLGPFVTSLLAALGRHAPAVQARAGRAAERLWGFFEAEAALPSCLCHGDYHPLNMIWGPEGIRAVIDWEFACLGHGLMDAANLLGCMAVEDPRALDQDCARAFVRVLREHGLLDGPHGPLLHAAVAASRFAWLSEWLRRGDKDMVELELDLLEILVERQDACPG